MKKKTLFFIGHLALLGITAKASPPPRLLCQTHWGEVFLKIQGNKARLEKQQEKQQRKERKTDNRTTVLFRTERITATTPDSKNDAKKPSSKKPLRFQETLREGEYTYHISIENPAQPNPLNDYLTIENKKGHQISYSVFCQSL